MGRRATYITILHSDDPGWVLVTILILMLVIQATALATVSTVRYGLMSAGAFQAILAQTDAAFNDAGTVTRTVLGAPEGWDHAAFLTEVRETTSGSDIQIHSLAWRALLREQSFDFLPEVRLASIRPHLLVVVDDSESFGWASGHPYAEEGVYLKRPSGEVVVADYDLAGADFLERPEGIYFSGRYGNSAMGAPFAEYYGGAMPSSTYYYPLLRQLIAGVELGEIAVATTARGIIQDFTHDRPSLDAACDSLCLGNGPSRLAESLYATLEAFPPECATARHVLLVSDGEALDDGNLPGAVQDFDHDGHPLDTYVEGIGSHCLDDVGAYAAAQGIYVHTMGPDRPYVRQVAAKGAGEYMPGPDDLIDSQAFATLMPLGVPAERLFLTSTHARFSPAWLTPEGAAYYRVDNGPHLTPVAPFAIPGVAVHAALDGETLYCTTSRDCLLSIDLITRHLNWAVQGLAGRLCVRSKVVMAGPDRYGRIVALAPGPAIAWTIPGACMDASQAMLYVGRGHEILGVDIRNGMVMHTYASTEVISALAFDPTRGVLMAGTDQGVLLGLSQDLVRFALLITGTEERIEGLRAFHHRKQPYVVALTAHHLIAAADGAVVWNAAMENGRPLQALVMDRRIYVTAWREDEEGCGGIDTGRSLLIVLDALSGAVVSRRDLFTGRAFGPWIDLPNGRLVFSNSAMAVQEEDITTLNGVKSCPLGTHIHRP